jgi:DNA oxidative demethylase
MPRTSSGRPGSGHAGRSGRFGRASQPAKSPRSSATAPTSIFSGASVAAVRRCTALPRGLFYDRRFLTPGDRDDIVRWLGSIHPIREQRYAPNHPPPPGKSQRWLLRPVYWLGNWQFACLDYYHPPKGVLDRCVRAEPYPAVLARLVAKSEGIARELYRGDDMPAGWRLNTCLVNFYGSLVDGDRRVDCARVGEHRDFEPGPVASISIGERAFFQFVSASRAGAAGTVAWQQWLEDGSLQIFGGDRWKRQLFHRVQRVERRASSIAVDAPGFEVRRVNFTFRYVPDAHIVRYAHLPQASADDVRGYMEQLAQHSAFFRRELEARAPAAV